MLKRSSVFLVFVFVFMCACLSQADTASVFFLMHSNNFIFDQTEFCKKYKCQLVFAKIPSTMKYTKQKSDSVTTILRYTPSAFSESNTIREEFVLTGYGKKTTGNPDLDNYTLTTTRQPINSSLNSFVFLSGSVELPRRYRATFSSDKRLPGDVVRVINDFTKSTVGQTYSEEVMRHEITFPNSQDLWVKIPESSGLFKYLHPKPKPSKAIDGQSPSRFNVDAYEDERVRQVWHIAF